MDDADRSQERTDAMEEALIRQAATAGLELEEHGRCHNCNDPVMPGCRFCDDTCRDDWQDRRKAEIRGGKCRG